MSNNQFICSKVTCTLQQSVAFVNVLAPEIKCGKLKQFLSETKVSFSRLNNTMCQFLSDDFLLQTAQLPEQLLKYLIDFIIFISLCMILLLFFCQREIYQDSRYLVFSPSINKDSCKTCRYTYFNNNSN